MNNRSEDNKQIFDPRLRQSLNSGQPVIGTFIQDVHSPFIMQVLSAAGLHFAVIDMEHGTFGLPEVAVLCQTGRLSGVSPLVRVASAEYHLIAPVLDAGAVGIVLPRMKSPEQIEQVLSWMRFPPLGERGFGGARGHSNYRNVTSESLADVEQTPVLAVMIETCEAVERLDEIISIPGVDIALIGPRDLSVALGCPNQLDHPQVLAAAAKIKECCLQRGMALGYVSADVDNLRRWKDAGASFLCYGTETALITNTYRSAREALGF